MAEVGVAMKTRIWLVVAVALGLASALTSAYAIGAIYRDGSLVSRGMALLFPVVALLCIYRDFGKRIFAALFAAMVVSVFTCLWLALGDEFGSFALLSVALVGLLGPIGVDLALLDTGTRFAVSPAVATAALAAFVVTFAPFTAVTLTHEHWMVVEGDQELIREVVQHVQVKDNAIVFEHVDPNRKSELQKRLVVRSEGKAYPLANAHFESVSRESTVQKKTEKHGSSETTVVSRERDEDMRIVVDVDRKPTTIVLYSTRGPMTICEQEIWLSGDEETQDPVS